MVQSSAIDFGSLVIADKDNNILAIFDNGHIRTKNFDSQNVEKLEREIDNIKESSSYYTIHTVSIADYNNNLRLAVNSINPTDKDRYIIEIPEGVYDATQRFTAAELDGTVACSGVNLKNYIRLQGVGNKENIIIQLNNSVYNDELSILATSFWNEMDNITLIASNLRYAVHDDTWDSHNNGKYLNITNCDFHCDNGRPSWGAGHSGKCHAKFENCRFYTTGISYKIDNQTHQPDGVTRTYMATFAYHDNYYTKDYSAILLRNCRFYVEDSDAPSLQFQTYGIAAGGEYDTYVTLEGCKGNTFISLTTSNNNVSDGTWYISGFANSMASSPVISDKLTGDTSKLIDLI